MHTIRSAVLLDRSRVHLRPSRGSDGRRLVGLLVAVWSTLVLWQWRASQRHALARLDGRLLADMGLSPADAGAETAKPFWRA